MKTGVRVYPVLERQVETRDILAKAATIFILPVSHTSSSWIFIPILDKPLNARTVKYILHRYTSSLVISPTNVDTFSVKSTSSLILISYRHCFFSFSKDGLSLIS